MASTYKKNSFSIILKIYNVKLKELKRQNITCPLEDQINDQSNVNK